MAQWQNICLACRKIWLQYRLKKNTHTYIHKKLLSLRKNTMYQIKQKFKTKIFCFLAYYMKNTQLTLALLIFHTCLIRTLNVSWNSITLQSTVFLTSINSGIWFLLPLNMCVYSLNNMPKFPWNNLWQKLGEYLVGINQGEDNLFIKSVTFHEFIRFSIHWEKFSSLKISHSLNIIYILIKRR